MLVPILLLAASQAALPPTYWGALTPGPHPVGFSQRWVIDSTRRLPHGDRFGLTYRPILLNLWYPASRAGGTPMPWSELFDGAVRAAVQLRGAEGYGRALMAYQRKVAYEELARAVPDSTAPSLRRKIEQFFTRPTYSHRNAPRGSIRGVVVYTQGSRSSMDDNVVLCEFLASRGYLVIGSGYPGEDDSEFDTNASDDSRPRDIRRLLLEVSRMGVPRGRVSVIGHSAGAQAMLRLAADPSAPIDAILSLDTTEDYSMLSDRLWAYFTDAVVAARLRIQLPIVFAAGPDGLFELADSLRASPRWLLTVPDLDHNDFISQGNIRRQLLAGEPDDHPAERVAAARSYAGLLGYIADWLDAQASGRSEVTIAPTPPLHVTPVPPGVSYPETGTTPPVTARQVRHLFATLEPEAFATIATELRHNDTTLASNRILMMLLVDAMRRDQAGHAQSVYRALLEKDSTVAGIRKAMESRAALFERIRITAEAVEWKRFADLLEHF